MKSFGILVAATASLLSSATAQQNYVIDPKNVPLNIRNVWCQNQETQCPLICLQTAASSSETNVNQCDPVTLTYGCICSNGLSPNVSQYSQTLPYYICQEWGNECVSNCGNGNSACQSSCRQDHPCGALSPSPPNKTMTTSSASGSASASSSGSGGGQTVYNGFGQGSGSTASGSGSASAGMVNVPTAVIVGNWYGLPILMAGLTFGFAVLL